MFIAFRAASTCTASSFPTAYIPSMCMLEYLSFRHIAISQTLSQLSLVPIALAFVLSVWHVFVLSICFQHVEGSGVSLGGYHSQARSMIIVLFSSGPNGVRIYVCALHLVTYNEHGSISQCSHDASLHYTAYRKPCTEEALRGVSYYSRHSIRAFPLLFRLVVRAQTHTIHHSCTHAFL